VIKLITSKMKKIELKDIASYLPYGLRCEFEYDYSDTSIEEVETFVLEHDKVILIDIYGHEMDNAKPILRPMSDLYKPCLKDGKIPIVELAKYEISGTNGWASPMFNYEIHKNEWEQEYLKYNPYLLLGAYMFFFYSPDKTFKKYQCISDTGCEIGNQLLLFQMLYEWHFDIHGLIEQGLAIDINTLPSN